MLDIDLNCDMGEGGDDASLMPLITSANIACGGHAGDVESMRCAVERAMVHGVNIGAHPGYDDRANFGRAAREVPSDQLRDSIAAQLRVLQQIVHAAGGRLRHVKPHGALYNAAIGNAVVAGAIVDAVFDVDASLAIVTLPHGRLIDHASTCGIETIAEAFADRTYQPGGTLTPRSDPSALIVREIDAADQVLWIVRDGCVRSVQGEWIPMRVQTVCIHGDGARALPLLRMLKQTLAAAGIGVRPF